MKARIALVFFVGICVVPLSLGMGYSLLYSLGCVGLLSEGFTFSYWLALWSSAAAWKSLGYTFYLMLLSLSFILVLAVSSAWLLWQQGTRFRGRFLFYIPLTFPPLIAAFVAFHWWSPAGFLARVAYSLGLIEQVGDFPRLVQDTYGISILGTHIFLIFPLFALLFAEQAHKARMDALWVQARTLGASRWYFFRRIFVPLVLRRSHVLILLYAIFLLGTYEVPMLLGQSSPRVITLFITDKMQRYNLADIPLGHAMAVTYSLCIALSVRLFLWLRARTKS